MCIALPACTQNTKSMMNNASVELVEETTVNQIALKNLDSKAIDAIARDYQNNANGALDLSITYNPNSKSFTAMNAIHALGHIKEDFQSKGVKNITTHTIPVEQGVATLMYSYDILRAQAPSDCTPMPATNINNTTRFIGDYKFGCGVETALSKQIANPADLHGNATLDQRDARRESMVIEEYSKGVPRERLDGIERDSL